MCLSRDVYGLQYIVNCCASDGLGNALPDHPGLDYIELTSDDMTHEVREAAEQQ